LLGLGLQVLPDSIAELFSMLKNGWESPTEARAVADIGMFLSQYQ
jgi:hypothetical protein